MRTGSIYLITNKTNGMQYVGQTINTVEDRWKQHKNQKARKNDFFHSAIQKYGDENFIVETIEEKIPAGDELDNKEQFYIKKYNTLSPNGYNLTTGGRSGRKYDIDEKVVVDLYTKSKCINDIVRTLGIPKATISQILKKNNIEILSSSDVGRAKSKAVRAYDANTKHFVKEYESAHEALRELLKKGIVDQITENRIDNIRAVCSKNKNQKAFGYYWRYADEVPQDFVEIKDNSLKHAVVMIDLLSGEQLKTFSSTTEAAIYIIEVLKQNKTIKRIREIICQVCRGNSMNKTAFGYTWRYEVDCKEGKKYKISKKNAFVVNMLNNDGDVVNTFGSIKKAAEFLISNGNTRNQNHIQHQISTVCKRKNNELYGYRWVLVHVDEINEDKKRTIFGQNKKQAVIMLDKDTLAEIKRFSSITEAKKYIANNTSYKAQKSGTSQISKACKMNKVAFGHRWKFA